MNKDVFKFDLLEKVRLTEKYNMPILKGTMHIPAEVISFNYALSTKDRKNKCVHFYIDDYQFERVWNKPYKFLEVLKQFKAVIMPDFSLYKNMPLPLQLYNSYRSKLLASFWENNGIEVIPNLNWSDENSLNFSLEGLPKYSVVALSTNGVLKNKEEFLKCFNKAIEILKPIKIILIGGTMEELKINDKIIKFNSHIDYLENLKKDGKM